MGSNFLEEKEAETAGWFGWFDEKEEPAAQEMTKTADTEDEIKDATCPYSNQEETDEDASDLEETNEAETADTEAEIEDAGWGFGFDLGLPEIDLGLPEIDLGLDGEFGIGLPDLDLGLNFTLPEIDLGLPEIDLGLDGEFELGQSDLDLGLDLCIPETDLGLYLDLPSLILDLNIQIHGDP